MTTRIQNICDRLDKYILTTLNATGTKPTVLRLYEADKERIKEAHSVDDLGRDISLERYRGIPIVFTSND